MKRSYEIDMCSGPLLPKILLFFRTFDKFPQEFWAAVIQCCRYHCRRTPLEAAMAAEVLLFPFNNLIINIFLGFSIGSSALMARYYGAKEDGNIKELVHTSVLLAIISGCFFNCQV